MDIIQAIAVIGSLLLFYALALSALSASSQPLPHDDTTTEETQRLREGLWLIALSFFVILAVLVWRAY
jgi:hypothetical protein